MKTAIVTGAGAGIGQAVARRLAAEGAALVCCSKSSSAGRVAEAIRAEGGKAIALSGDVGEEGTCRRIVEEALAAFGRIDILVNNAGIVIPGGAENTRLSDWDETMKTNVRSVYLLSTAALPALIEAKGVIVNTASSVALKGVKDRLAYSASKGAVLSMSRAMAADLVGRGVRVNCVCPGTTLSPSLEGRLRAAGDYEKAKEAMEARQAMGRFGRPEEVAEAVIFLIHDEFCTGTVLSVDGGMTM